MRRKYGILTGLLATVILTGCSLFQPEYERVDIPDTIEVPVYQPCPVLTIQEDKELPIHQLDEESNYEDISKAYVQSIEILKYRIESYEAMIEICKDYDIEDFDDIDIPESEQ